MDFDAATWQRARSWGGEGDAVPALRLGARPAARPTAVVRAVPARKVSGDARSAAPAVMPGSPQVQYRVRRAAYSTAPAASCAPAPACVAAPGRRRSPSGDWTPVVIYGGAEVGEHTLRLEGCRSLVILDSEEGVSRRTLGQRAWRPAVRTVCRSTVVRQVTAEHVAQRAAAQPAPTAAAHAAARAPGSLRIRSPALGRAESRPVEEGWRWRELSCAPGGAPKLPARGLVEKPGAAPQAKEDGGWRFLEISCACCLDAPASVSGLGRSARPPTAEKERAADVASPGSEAAGDATTAPSSGCSFDAGDVADLGIEVDRHVGEDAVLPEVARVAAGDIVLLGPGVPAEHRLRTAVVTKVAEAHCTVVVLDSEQRSGIGECWPNMKDVVAVESTLLRLGTSVVLRNLRGARTKRLNGFSGVVAAHPQQGHPTFVSKPSAPEHPQLTVCIKFDDPAAAGEKSALIEPRFLVPYRKAAEDVALRLSDTLGSLAEKLRLADEHGAPGAGARHVASGTFEVAA